MSGIASLISNQRPQFLFAILLTGLLVHVAPRPNHAQDAGQPAETSSTEPDTQQPAQETPGQAKLTRAMKSLAASIKAYLDKDAKIDAIDIGPFNGQVQLGTSSVFKLKQRLNDELEALGIVTDQGASDTSVEGEYLFNDEDGKLSVRATIRDGRGAAKTIVQQVGNVPDLGALLGVTDVVSADGGQVAVSEPAADPSVEPAAATEIAQTTPVDAAVQPVEVTAAPATDAIASTAATTEATAGATAVASSTAGASPTTAATVTTTSAVASPAATVGAVTGAAAVGATTGAASIVPTTAGTVTNSFGAIGIPGRATRYGMGRGCVEGGFRSPWLKYDGRRFEIGNRGWKGRSSGFVPQASGYTNRLNWRRCGSAGPTNSSFPQRSFKQFNGFGGSRFYRGR